MCGATSYAVPDPDPGPGPGPASAEGRADTVGELTCCIERRRYQGPVTLSEYDAVHHRPPTRATGREHEATARRLVGPGLEPDEAVLPEEAVGVAHDSRIRNPRARLRGDLSEGTDAHGCAGQQELVACRRHRPGVVAAGIGIASRCHAEPSRRGVHLIDEAGGAAADGSRERHCNVVGGRQ